MNRDTGSKTFSIWLIADSSPPAMGRASAPTPRPETPGPPQHLDANPRRDPGPPITAGPQGVSDGLRILAQGGEIDYEGAAGSIDWDKNGDLRRGHIGIWRFTRDERIEEVGAVAFAR